MGIRRINTYTQFLYIGLALVKGCGPFSKIEYIVMNATERNKTMKENILKAYKNEKDKIDIWFRMAVRNNDKRNRKTDAMECVFHIGKAFMLAQILRVDFGEDTKEESKHMKQIKDYLQRDFLESLEMSNYEREVV